ELIILDANYPSGRGWRRAYCEIASDILAKSNRPVLIVPGNGRPIQRILLCDSGAGNAPLLNRLTTQVAKVIAGEEEITVLHVMSQISAGPGIRGTQLRADAETLMAEHAPEGELLAEDLRALQHPGLHPHPKVRHGMVVDEILAEASSGDYDLVIIGARRGERWQRLLLADLARKIIAQIDRPLLVVP
ncbi:MAG: universal stress protein, partial [Anaerolineales bacterium]|nr:universal stress protein [Anaerolineales bacterium]